MRADRLLSLLFALQAEGQISAPALAKRLEVSVRTIYRDVEALSMAGVPIYASTGRTGGIALDETYRVALSGVQAEDLQALFVTGAQAPLQQLGMGGDERTVATLLGMLSRVQQQKASFLRERIFIDPTGWYGADDAPHLAQLQRAVWESRQVKFAYANWQGINSDVQADAYGLVFKAGAWYLVARKIPNKIRIYRVGRIVQLQVEHRFERDETFDLHAYWHEAGATFLQNTAQYEVIMRVTQEAFFLIERLLAHRFKLQEETHDTYIIKASFGDIYEARSFLLTLGAEATILAPDDLRNAILKHTQSILHHYHATDKDSV
jgi:predicted DNA-binding transcriptional regulator YafY